MATGDFNLSGISGGSSGLAAGDVIETYRTSSPSGVSYLPLDGSSYLRSAYSDVETLFPFVPGQGLTLADTSAITYGSTSRVRQSPKMIASNGSGTVIAAATRSDDALMIIRSTDNGLTWTEVFNTTQAVQCSGIHYCQNDYCWIFTARNGNAAGHAYRSTDGGATWAEQSINLNTNLQIDSAYDSDNDDIYIAYNTSSGNQGVRVNDASTVGRTFSNVSFGTLPASPVAVAADTTASVLTILVATSTGSIHSSNNGTSFSSIGSVGFTPEQGQLAILGDNAIACSGSALRKSTDKGVNWTTLNTTLASGGASTFTFENGYLAVTDDSESPDSLIVSSDAGNTFGDLIEMALTNPQSLHISSNSALYTSTGLGDISLSIEDATVFYLPDLTSETKRPLKVVTE